MALETKDRTDQQHTDAINQTAFNGNWDHNLEHKAASLLDFTTSTAVLTELLTHISSEPENNQIVTSSISGLLNHYLPQVRLSALNTLISLTKERVDLGPCLFAACLKEHDLHLKSAIAHAGRASGQTFNLIDSAWTKVSTIVTYGRKMDLKLAVSNKDRLTDANFAKLACGLLDPDLEVLFEALNHVKRLYGILTPEQKESLELLATYLISDPVVPDSGRPRQSWYIDCLLSVYSKPEPLTALFSKLLQSDNPILRFDTAINMLWVAPAHMQTSHTVLVEVIENIETVLGQRVKLHPAKTPTEVIDNIEYKILKEQQVVEFGVPKIMSEVRPEGFHWCPDSLEAKHLALTRLERISSRFNSATERSLSRCNTHIQGLTKVTNRAVSEVNQTNIVQQLRFAMHLFDDQIQIRFYEQLSKHFMNPQSSVALRKTSLRTAVTVKHRNDQLCGSILQIVIEDNTPQLKDFAITILPRLDLSAESLQQIRTVKDSQLISEPEISQQLNQTYQSLKALE